VPGLDATVADAVHRLRAACAALPETSEEQAWTGTRWVVRTKNFAHVVAITDGRPAAYAAAAGTAGPSCVLTFRCALDDVEAFRRAGPPWFVPPWFPNIVGCVLDERTDWADVLDCVVESYCVVAPKALAARVAERHRPTGDQP
jgi:hypothetical protein